MEISRLIFDTSTIEGQLLETRFFEGLSSDILRDFPGLTFDIVLSEGATALDADGTNEVFVGLGLRSSREHFRTAARTDKRHIAHAVTREKA